MLEWQAGPHQVSLPCHGDKKILPPRPLSHCSPLPKKFVLRDLTILQIKCLPLRWLIISLMADHNFSATLSSVPVTQGEGGGLFVGALSWLGEMGLPPPSFRDPGVVTIRN